MEKVILSKRFDLIEKETQIQWLHHRIQFEFGNETFSLPTVNF
jgi:hypothetical protein